MTDVRIRTEPRTLHIQLAPGLALVDQACRAVRQFLDVRELGASTFDVLLLCREALCNAVLHGCGKRSAGMVHLRLELGEGPDSDWLTIRVADTGSGFDWQGCGRELPSEFEVSGRGLWIIRAYCEDVAFNEAGNEITMRKRLTA